jgi:hypothetical protein
MILLSLGVIRKAISDLGKSSYISVVTGFWYEWSLGISSAYGFDFANRKVTFFDDGETKICTSTWPQVSSIPEGSNNKVVADTANLCR